MRALFIGVLSCGEADYSDGMTRAESNAMDHCALSASVFHKLADRYREKLMDLTMYNVHAFFIGESMPGIRTSAVGVGLWSQGAPERIARKPEVI
jgi:hypothetical protein